MASQTSKFPVSSPSKSAIHQLINKFHTAHSHQSSTNNHYMCFQKKTLDDAGMLSDTCPQ